MDTRILPIVLSAGESRRMGRPKLFLPLYGSTLLRLAAQAAQELTRDGDVLIVTGAYDAEIREHLGDDPRLIYVHNPNWRTGMSSSIISGVSIASMLGPTHYFITLADQPSMGAESLAFLADESLRFPERIIATRYPERLGVPAIFPIAYTDELKSLNGKFGARQLIAQKGEQVRAITFNKPPVDLDTWEEYLAAGGEEVDEA